jgi:AcrR family transcriptional regulator
MAKTWTADNPKAALMARKRAAIVGAATEAFLDAGYAESSVNQIAAAAGVSIKTLYRHFDSKDELFSAVMQAACGTVEGVEAPAPDWYEDPPSVAGPRAGAEYLAHALSREQIALYRVVTRDAHRFPELGRRYQQVVIGGRDAVIAGYLDRWIPKEGWTVRNKTAAGQAFVALLKAGVFDEVLHGLRTPDAVEIAERAAEASRRWLILLAAGRF